MVNLLHLCETMSDRGCEEDELRVPIEVLKRFAKKNHFIVERKTVDDKTLYKLTRKKIPIFFISGEEETEFKFMDIADLHIGNKNFNEKALREKLEYAVNNGINMVFIAGDLFEGCLNERIESHYYEQIGLAYSIFKDYPLTYYAINGNHDYTFEQLGLQNPIKRLEIMLRAQGIDFNFFDVYLMDFIICGVIKRVMHVERQDFSKKRIFAALKLKAFDEEKKLSNYYKGKEYRVRFFQVGHIHVNVQMYYAKRKIFISQSGSFIDDETPDERANILQGRVIDEKVFMN